MQETEEYSYEGLFRARVVWERDGFENCREQVREKVRRLLEETEATIYRDGAVYEYFDMGQAAAYQGILKFLGDL